MTNGTADSTGIKTLRRSSRIKSKTSSIKPPLARIPPRASSQNTAILDALKALSNEVQSLRAHVDDLQAQQPPVTQQHAADTKAPSPTSTVEHGQPARSHNPNVGNTEDPPLSLPLPPSGEVDSVNIAGNNDRGSPHSQLLPPSGGIQPVIRPVNDVRGSPVTHPLPTQEEVCPVNPTVNYARGTPFPYPFHMSRETYPINSRDHHARGVYLSHPLPPSGEVYPVNPADHNVRGAYLSHPLPPSGEVYPVNPADHNVRGAYLSHPLPPSGEVYPVNSADHNARGASLSHPIPPSREVYPVNSATDNTKGTFFYHHSPLSGEAHPVNTAVSDSRRPTSVHLSPTSRDFFSANPAGKTTRCLSIQLPSPSEVSSLRHADNELIDLSPRSQRAVTSRAVPTAPQFPTRVHGSDDATAPLLINHNEHQPQDRAFHVVTRKLSVQDCITRAQTIGNLLPGKSLWCGSRDIQKRTFAETRQLVTTSMSYKWSPPCTQYFLTRQVYAPFIVQRLDLWETKQDYGPLLSCAQDPYSTYWKEATRRQWFYLSACFDKHNSDSLECRWSDLKLTPNLHWDDYITQFEVVASQLAQARGVNALTQAELRAHLYLSLPKALQAHCVQLGYNVGEKRMDYDGLVNTCAGWCELNWQTLAPAAGTATVNNVALASVPSAESCTPQVITSSSTTTQENQQKTDKKTRPTRPSTPYRQRIKDDSSILNDEYNIKILSSRCQRCLSESHDTIACCEELTKKDERCYYCGLIHHHSRHCPAGHDNYRGRNCERCNKVNHAARACRRYRPGAAPVAAAIPSTGVPKSASTTGTPPLSFINLYVNHSSGHTPALVDSGAAVSVVSSSAAASLNLTVSRADLRIRLADLSETPVRGVAKSVPISFSNGSRCTEDLYVLDGCAHQLILSVGLLRRLKAIWHLHDNYIVFGDNEDGQPISMVSMPKPRNEPSSPSVYSSTVAELCNIMVSEARSTQRGTCCDVDTSESNTITLPQDVWETLALSFFPEPREDDSSPTKGLTRSQTIDAFRDQFTDQRSSEKHGNDLFDFSIDPPSDTAPRGRLHCKVPWRDAARPSPIHNQSAIKRDCIVMARLTDAEASSYHQVVNDLYTLGFVVPARLQSTPDTEPSTVMYTDHSLPPVSTLIPAFPVFRKCSKTSKTRLVLDCKYHNGFLRSGRQANDTTYPETLWANLALSRTAKAMVVDDISKAYHQIKLGDALDRRHFGMMACGRVGMWVSTCSGATYSPSALLQANKAVLTLRDFESGHITRDQALTDPVCRSLISQFEGNLKLGSLTLNHGDVSGKNSATSNNGQDPLLKHTAIYVDDGQTRGKTKEVALKRANFFTATQSGHGFHSNVPKRSRSWGPITSTKYLGYGWQTGDESDQLSPTFRVPEAFDLDNPPSTITRRQLFSLCQGLYDPLGLASEYSLCLRLFMATYYTVDVTNHAGKPPNLWDIDIDPEGAANVLSFCRALTTADLLYPRFADISNMMVFTDASVTAGHATILCPTTDSEGSVFYHKLVGKGRLWSTRTSQARWSIPKKELVAFFDGLTLATSLVTLYSKLAIETPIKCLSLYCDSEALLYRLRRASKGDFGKTLSNLEKKALKRGLVDLNHIATTLRVPVTTYHIEGEANPADTGSRPKINGQLPSPLEDAVIEKGINAAHAKNLSYVYTLEATPVTDVLSYDTISVANHFNNDQLLKFQQEDGRARAIVDTLNSTPSAEVAHNLRLYHICPDSGLLLYSGVSDSNGGTACRPVLPRGQGCDEVLSLLHDKLGHDNAPKLRSLYNEAFYTPKLRIALLRLLKTCHVCQLAKKQSGYKKRAGCVRPAHLCFDIGQVWCLDHAGPYRCPVSGEKIWVLTCCDPVSGFLLYDNTTSPTASSICSSLIKLFSIVGDPACITVDAGSAMTSRAVEGFCVTRSIAFTVFPRQSKFIAAVYERGHGLLLSQLRHRLLQEEDQPRPLPDTIAEAVYGINCSPRHDLGTLSAFQLFYCRRPRLLAPAEELEDWSRAKLENWIPSITEGQPPTMSSELKAIYDDLQERRTRSLLDFFTLVKEAKDRIRARASKLPQQSGFKAFDIGSLVLRLVPPPLKQDVSWRGPYRVVAVSDDQLLYRLEDVKTGTQLKFQECYFNLKQYHAKNPVLESLPVPTVQDGSTLNLTDGDLYCFRWIDGHGCEHRDFGLYDSDLKKMVLRKVHIDGSIEILTDFIDQQYVCDVDIHYECPLRMTRSIKNRIIKYIEGGNLCDAD